jgi:hypothetical protein
MWCLLLLSRLLLNQYKSAGIELKVIDAAAVPKVVVAIGSYVAGIMPP